MNDVIKEYQKWKQQGEDLRVHARQAMEARYREVLSEAVQIAEEYRADFGTTLKPPAPITAFRYKASAKSKPKKPTVKGSAAKNREVPEAAPPAAKPKSKDRRPSDATGDGEKEA